MVFECLHADWVKDESSEFDFNWVGNSIDLQTFEFMIMDLN